MVNSYKTGRSANWRKLALLGLLGLATSVAQAQTLNYSVFTAANTTTTYTDLGTTGTVITTPDNDDANSAATPIGFSFSYNGTTFTDFVLNTNGFLKLGTTAPAAPYFFSGPQATTGGPINSTTETNLLLPFNLDLEGTATTEYRTATTGTAPNRVTTIQWKNVSDKLLSAATGKQLASISFQVKLYETTNNIEFVYGPSTAGASTDAFKAVGVGIKGSGITAAQLILATKGSVSAWNTTSFLAGPYTGNAHNVRKSVLADAGRTYRFSPSSANDATVQNIYTLGKLPIPYAVPHTIQAVVRNVGTGAMSNITVTATVAGANTFTSTKTIATLASGAITTVAFDPFTPTATGNETVTVTLSGDDNATNNTVAQAQEVSATTFSYITPGVGATAGGLGFSTASNIFAAKYSTTAQRSVTAVSAFIEDAASVGKTVYGVVTNAAGTIIGRSPDYVVTAADISTLKTFTLSTPATVNAGDFYVGLAQIFVTGSPYFPMGLQAETPTRAGAFYTIPLAGGTPTDAATQNFGKFMLEAVTTNPATCLAPTGVTVTAVTTTGGTVTFTGPAAGTGYTIIYGPAGFNPASAGTTVTTTASPYTLTGLTASTNYDLYIRANCGATDQSSLTGPISFSTPCQTPIITTFPYTENFDGVAANALPCGISLANVNNDAKTWRVSPSFTTPGGTVVPVASSGTNAIIYEYSATAAADDWFFTPPLFLRAGSSYQLSFKYRTFDALYPERLEVKYGSAATPTGVTTSIWNNAAITNVAYATTGVGNAPAVTPIVPTATGNYYVGFHVYSAADQYVLALDDIQITSTTTGVSKALLSAVNVYPNPSAGQFTVQVRGANAKGAMQVEVTNLLGQRVHTATIRDNFENKLDLSNLANGMYTLKVKSGNDYMIQNLVVQK